MRVPGTVRNTPSDHSSQRSRPHYSAQMRMRVYTNVQRRRSRPRIKPLEEDDLSAPGVYEQVCGVRALHQRSVLSYMQKTYMQQTYQGYSSESGGEHKEPLGNALHLHRHFHLRHLRSFRMEPEPAQSHVGAVLQLVHLQATLSGG